MNEKLKKTLIIIFWIAVWTAIAFIIGSPLVLAGPVDVAKTLGELLITTKFWATVGISFLRIGIGFMAACIIGCALAVLSYKFKTFYDFISPMIQLTKSAPLVCIIVLLLVWFGVGLVDIIAVCLAVIPVFFFAILTACKERNTKILNTLKIYKVPAKTIWNMFEWPSIMPYFYQATQTGIGLSWKSGATAQMIGAVSLTIGEGVYMSKLMLDSAQLLIWMFVVVLLGWASEKLLVWAIKKISAAQTKSSIKAISKIAPKSERVGSCCKNQPILTLTNISKSFAGKTLMENFNLELKPGDRIAFVDPIGTGKSTLLNIILGLEKPDAGTITQACSSVGANTNNASTNDRTFSVIFQENTLLDNLTVQENIMVAAQKPVSEKTATKLTGSNAQAKELSGGMKRCAEIERAIIADSAAVIMDEPFAGLDSRAKERALAYVKANLNGRALVLVTHNTEDAKALGCQILALHRV